MSDVKFQPVYGSSKAVSSANKEPGKLYFSSDGVTLGKSDGTSEQLVYGKEKINELLSEKADNKGIDDKIKAGVAAEVAESQEQFEKLKALAEWFESEGGDVTALGEAVKKNTEDITKKADKETVDDLTQEVNKKADRETVDSLTQEVEKKADEETVDSIKSDVEGLKESKADTTSVTDLEGRVETVETTVSTKADSETVSSLEGRVTTVEGTANEAKSKADEVESTLETKADNETVTELTQKVTEVQTTANDAKSKADELETSLGSKADSTRVEELSSSIESVTAQLENKADSTELDGLISATVADSKYVQISDEVTQETIKGAIDGVGELKTKYGEDHTKIETLEGEVANKAETSAVEEISNDVADVKSKLNSKADSSALEEFISESEADERYLQIGAEITQESVKSAITTVGTLQGTVDQLQTSIDEKVTTENFESFKAEVESDYLKTETADESYIKTDDVVTNESLKSVVTAVSPLEDVISSNNGVDINLQSDGDTFSVNAQNGNIVEVGKAGNIRMIPSVTETPGDDPFTEGIVLVDPVTKQAVAGIGFSGKVKAASAMAVEAIGQTEVEYIYIGLNNNQTPLLKITTEDGKLYLGDDEEDIVTKIEKLQETVRGLSSQGYDEVVNRLGSVEQQIVALTEQVKTVEKELGEHEENDQLQNVSDSIASKDEISTAMEDIFK